MQNRTMKLKKMFSLVIAAIMAISLVSYSPLTSNVQAAGASNDEGYMTTITIYGADLGFGPLTDDQNQNGPGSVIKSGTQYLMPFGAFAEASSGRRSNKDRFYLGDAHYQAGGGEAVRYFTLVLSVEDDTIPLPASLVCMPLSYWYAGPWIADIRTLEYYNPTDAAKDELKPFVTKVGRDYYLTFDLGEPSTRLQGGNGGAWSEHRSIGLEPYANNWGSSKWTEAGVTVKSATFTFIDLPEDRRNQDTNFTSRAGLNRIPTFNQENVAKPEAGEFSVPVTGADASNFSFSLSDAVFAPRAPYLHSLYFDITTQAGVNIKNDLAFQVDLPAGASQKVAPTRAIKIGENRYSVAVELFEDTSGYLGLTSSDSVTLRTTKGADKVVSVDAVTGAFLNLPTELAPPPIAVANVTVNPKTLELVEGRSGDIAAIVNPSNAANKEIVWTTSDDGIASVNQKGKVTAISEGSCLIYATSADGGISDFSTITVIADPDAERPKYDPFPTEEDGSPVHNEVLTLNTVIASDNNRTYSIDLMPYAYKLASLTSIIVTSNANGNNGGGVFIGNSDLGNSFLVGDTYVDPAASDNWYGKTFSSSSQTMNIAQDTFIYSDVTNRQAGVEHWWGSPITVYTVTLVFTPSGVDPAEKYTISLDANGGSVSPSSLQTNSVSKLPSLPTPIREGYKFDGWFTLQEGGYKVSLNTVFNAEATIYAHWTEIIDVPPVDELKLPELILSSDSEYIIKGQSFYINSAFEQEVKSNVTRFTYTYDSDMFDYVGFEPADGVTVLNSVASDGKINLTLMIDDYAAKNFGNIEFLVKQDMNLEDDYTYIKAQAEVVVINQKTEIKELLTTTAELSIGTFNGIPGDVNGDGVFDLIDLSDLIDAYGMESSDPLWSNFKNFDFNKDGEIDVSDIAKLASMLV